LRRALGQVVQAPVETVKIEMNERPTGGGLAHPQLEPAPELITGELLGVARRIPGVAIVGTGSEDERIELARRATFIQEILTEPTRAVLAFEQQPERMFSGDVPVSEVSALDPQTAINLELIR